MSLNDLTDGEKAYLESGGTDTAGLMAENPDAGVSADQVTEHKIDADKPIAAATEAKTQVAPADLEDHPDIGEEEVTAADGKTKRRMVDKRALKAERERSKALEAELGKFKENYSRVDERLKMLSEAVTASDPASQAVEAPVIPDPEQDIFGYAKYLATELEALKASHGAAQAETQEERQTRAVISTYTRDRDVFVQKQPDFMDGYNFLLGTRKAQLELQGYSPEEVSRWLVKEEMDLVNRSLQNKVSPAQTIYGLAKSMGYAPKAAVPAVPAAAAKPAAPSVTDEIDRIKRGQAASMSLSNGNGSAGEELSLEWLANLPMKEFEAFMSKGTNRERVEQAMGRAA